MLVALAAPSLPHIILLLVNHHHRRGHVHEDLVAITMTMINGDVVFGSIAGALYQLSLTFNSDYFTADLGAKRAAEIGCNFPPS